MKDRVRELRRRLAPVLEVVSAQARRDIEELFELASQPGDENTRLLREVRDALDLVERATGVTPEPRPRRAQVRGFVSSWSRCSANGKVRCRRATSRPSSWVAE